MVLIIAGATIISTLLGGWFAIRFKDKLHLILGFSAGAVIGVALFDLLPESAELIDGTADMRLMALLIAAGFTAFLTLDRLFSLHFHGENECEQPSHRSKIAAGALAFHSMLDGLGIGLAFKISPAVGIIVAAAVLAHDFSDGINTVGIIFKNKGSRREAIKWLITDAVAPAVGILASFFITVSEPTLGLILSVFTGLFLYIGASDLIPESHHRHPTIWTTIMTIAGMVVIYIAVSLAK